MNSNNASEPSQSSFTGRLSIKEKINRALVTFSRNEQRVFAVLVVALVVSSLALLQLLNQSLMTQVPLSGGMISEGIVGAPRFINPVLASSPADLDLVALIYSGLMRRGTDGNFVPDLAEKYEVSENGLVYTFTLKDKAYFHNGESVTVDDVIFTIDRVKNSVIKSPEKINWDGVNVEKIGEQTLEFTLRQPDANFLQNATLGIMPQSLWASDSLELNAANTAPVGSGPYRIENATRESNGVITSYQLAAFEKFALDKPHLKEIRFYFYPNETDLVKALEDGTVDQVSSITPEIAETLKEKGYRVESEVMPRVFGLFFNQNKNQIFLDQAVARAINEAIDKEKIVREVLFGYGVPTSRPIPESLAGQEEISASQRATREETVQKVREDLKKNGWAENTDGFFRKTTTDKTKKKTTVELTFTIATGNAPELAQTAELIKTDLAQVGIKVEVQTFEIGNLNQNVIRPREYDALLFGQVINRKSDLFAFWHSSQRKDPGQNVALYTNARADKLLEESFITVNDQAREEKYAALEREILKDMPAVFLYNPDLIYVVAKTLRGLSLEHITSPADRFRNINSWFTKTENVWKIFNKKS